MKNYIHVILINSLLMSLVISQNMLSLEYTEGNSLKINLSNTDEIGGFQLAFDGIDILSAEGGSAAVSGFNLSVNGDSSTVLGFSFSGGSIPPGEGHMTTLIFDSDTIGDGELPCFKLGNDSEQANLPYCQLSDPMGYAINVELGECADGCFNNSACNFLTDGECVLPTNYYQDADEDGLGNPDVSQPSCEDVEGYVTNSSDDDDTCQGTISELDGSCCISEIFDECGVCDGDGSSCADCAGVPNGDSLEDECGVCDGDGLSCAGCDGIANSGVIEDECGNCGGDCIIDNNGIIVCSGILNTPENLVIANCFGVCGGDSCLGCMDSIAENYNADATIDDGSCEYLNTSVESTISEIVNNCGDDMGDTLTCDGQYNLSGESAAECPLYETSVTTTGTIVDYFDITPFNGPHSFTIEDANGNQIDFVIWPESSEYQDGFDITATDLNVLTQEPFGTYEVEITGELGAYCDDDELLDINSEWQITVEYESNIKITTDLSFESNGPFLISITSTYPNPFNPSINIEYSIASVGHVVLQIIALDGKHVDTITNSMQTHGLYSVQWTPTNISSGMYLLQLRVNNLVQNKKIIYLK